MSNDLGPANSGTRRSGSARVFVTLLLLRSDIVRLAIAFIHRSSGWIRTITFFLLLLLGSVISVLPLMVSAIIVKHHDVWVTLRWLIAGVCWTALGYGGSALLLSYTASIEMLTSENDILSILFRLAFGVWSLATVLVFQLFALSRGRSLQVFAGASMTLVIASLAAALLNVLVSHCPQCHTRP